MKKQIMSWILIIILSVTFFPMTFITGYATDDREPVTESVATRNGIMTTASLDTGVEGIWSYNISNGAATITGCSYQASGSVSVPETVKGYPVTAIDKDAFFPHDSNYYNNKITGINIPESIDKISVSAFNKLPGLENIVVDDSNVSYSSKEGVLFNKSQTELICCPRGKTGSYSVPGTVKIIKTQAFDECELTAISLNSGIETMEYWGIGFCDQLEQISIPDSLTYFTPGCILGCEKLTKVMISSGNPNYISKDGIVFNSDATELVCYPGGKTGHYTIPKSVSAIGDYAFSNHPNLTSVTIPEGIQYIGKSAFWNVNGLESVDIPKSVWGIQEQAFAACYGLQEIHVDAGNDYYSSSNGVLFSKSGATLVCFPAGRTGSYQLPAGINSISAYSFYDCKLSRVILNDGVRTIGKMAFFGSSELVDVFIPHTVNTIDAMAFLLSDSIKDVYYSGSSYQWSQIKTSNGNDKLLNAAIHFSSKASDMPPLPTPTPAPTPTLTPALKKPSITVQPNDFSGLVGDTAVFYIEATGENLTYQWQYSENRGDTWINTGDGVPATTCNEITSSCFGRLYRCIVSNANGSVVSNTAKIIRDETPSTVSSATDYFVIGRDSNSFLHSEIGNYRTSLHYMNKLTKGMSSTEILSLYDTINSMVESKEETQDSFGNTCHLWAEKWGGSCQGLSTLLGLCNLKKINPIQFQGTYGVQANCFSDVIYSEDLRNAVNYYHLLQYTDQWPSPTMKVYNASLPARVMANVIGSFESGWTPLSNVKSFWNSLAKAAKAGSETHVPLLFSFGNTEGVGHTILICGYSENQNYHIFKLYDCNSTNPRLRNLLPNRQQNYIYLFVSKSDQSFMLSSTGDTITEIGLYLNQDNWKYFEYYNADIWNQLDTQTEKASTLSVTSEETVTFMVDAGKAFKMVNSEGSTLQLKENTFSGDMEVYAFDILGDNQYYRFSIPVSDQYTITDFKDGTNFRVLGSDYYASAITQKTNAITFQNQRGIILDGKAISFVASVGGTNNSSLTRLESSGSNHVSIQNHADGVNIHSDKKSPVTVSVISDGVETNRGTTPANEIIQLDNQGKINSKTDEISFKDVDSSSWYADAVQWAVNHTPQITNGTSTTTFSPNANCTRAQMVTFLWRAAGEPVPRSSKNPFSDVKSSAYYYKAVLWAVEKGITNGTSATTFSPDATVTRAQTVTFLWRMEGQPKGNTTNPFKDVKAGQYYTDAVLWAVKNEITKGTSATTFAPDDSCTRAQIVTFLYRDFAKEPLTK